MTDDTNNDSNIAGYHWPSYFLSRFNFVVVHVFTLFYWLPFLFNNPLEFPWIQSTLDSDRVPANCTPIIWENVRLDIGLWAFWWLQHSVMSREVFKRAIGTWGTPIDRPLFGLASCVALATWTIFYKPVTDCSRTDFTDMEFLTTPRTVTLLAAVLVLFLFVVAYFWYLPSHVFGTDNYILLRKQPKMELILGFPYGIVRHPAAAGFLWMFWALPNYSINHLFYAFLWTVFIIIGTMFEEAGLHYSDHFGRQYKKYSAQVGAFVPRLGYFTGQSIKL